MRPWKMLTLAAIALLATSSRADEVATCSGEPETAAVVAAPCGPDAAVATTDRDWGTKAVGGIVLAVGAGGLVCILRRSRRGAADHLHGGGIGG